jgi:hypothetical protein
MTPRLRPRIPLALAAIALGGASACGSSEPEDAPAACLTPSATYVRALAAAPEEVRLEAGTPISDCLVPEQTGGQLATVGEQMIAAATALNEEARQDPAGAAAVRLGYLVGAVERGREGIHADLVRRLNAAARYSPEGLLPAEFERSFGEGYAAGLGPDSLGRATKRRTDGVRAVGWRDHQGG